MVGYLLRRAAVVAVFYPLFVSLFIYKGVKIKDLIPILKDAAASSATILIVIGTATAFGTIMSIERIPEIIANSMLALSSSPLVIMFIIVVVLLIVGMFMDTSAAVVIFTPILFPIAQQIGIDPIHFGVLMISTLAIALLRRRLGLTSLFQ